MSAINHIQLIFANQLGNKIQRKALSSQPGWYFVEVTGDFPLEKKEEYEKNYDIDFSIHNMVNGHMYHMYLNETQFDYLSSVENMNLYSTIKKVKTSKKLASTDEYSVYATKDWNPSYCKPFHEDGNRFIVSNVSESDLENDDKVRSFKHRIIPHVANRFSGGILQSGVQELKIDVSPEYGALLRTPRTLSHKGLTGKGQVVHVYDTGIDVNNTYFYDPDNLVTYNEFGYKHRKIIRYDTNADDSDHTDGHGTHVAGIVAGKASKTSETRNLVRNYHEHDGMVPDAKIYFTDGAVRENMAAVVDFDQLFANMKQVNAGVSSNSWGSRVEIIGTECPFNERAYNNPDITFIFAAGNEMKTMSVIPPGCCKNVLAVGNLDASKGYGVYEGRRKDWLEAADGTVFPVISTQKYYDYKVGINIINATVRKDFDNDGNRNSVYIYKGDGKDLENIRNQAKSKNFIGVINAQGTCNEETDFPCIKVSADTLSKIENLPTISALYESTRDDEIFLYRMSSKGPTQFGLSKPEVVAPGDEILAAMGLSNHMAESFQVTFKTGTSMATPAVSGMAVIARQYFQDGYYPSLKPTESDKMNVTAAVIKAIIINSAEPARNDRKYEPDDFYGFGQPIMDRALGFVDGIGVTFLDTYIKNGEHAMYKLNTEKKQNLTITMSYIDTFSTGVNLVYNLDLIVIGPNGEKFSGNHRENFSSDMSTVNERIHIRDAPAGEYKIHIISQPLKRTPYSEQVVTGIAVMGGFTTKKDLLVRSDEPDCLTDQCDSKGFSICPENVRGNFCQEDIVVPNTNQTSVELVPKYTKWLRIKPGKRTDLTFTTQKGQNFILDISKDKPIGQWLYSDTSMLLETMYQESITLPFEDYQDFVDENDEVYIGLTTVGRYNRPMKVELEYKPEPEKPKPPVDTPIPPVDTSVPPPPVETDPIESSKSTPSEEEKTIIETLPEKPSQGENNQAGSNGEKDPKSFTGIIAGSVVAGVIVIAGVVAAFFLIKRSKKVSTSDIDVDVDV